MKLIGNIGVPLNAGDTIVLNEVEDVVRIAGERSTLQLLNREKRYLPIDQVKLGNTVGMTRSRMDV